MVPPCQILRLRCIKIKFDFHWDSTPDPAGEDYRNLPDLLAAFKGEKGTEERKGGREG